jgi:dipeptidyl aminopeptidase/acylaminoacyl peptidase
VRKHHLPSRWPLLAGAALILASQPSRANAGPTIPELVEVSDITSLTASPSGKLVAFRLERPSIERNSYDIDWFVADLETGITRRVGGGGAPIYGDAGPIEIENVVWAPDERHLYHRVLSDGAIGVWRTAVDGSGSLPLVVADANVLRLQASPDGSALTYELGPTREEIARAEQREYEEGIRVDASVDLAQDLYRGGWVDGRLASQRLTGRWYGRAGLLWRNPRRSYRVDLRSLETQDTGPSLPEAASPLVPTRGSTLTLESPGRPTALVRWEDGRPSLDAQTGNQVLHCAAAACRSDRIVAAAWRPGSEELVFTTQDRHFRQSLHLWNAVSNAVRTMTQGEGLLSGSRDPNRPCAVTPIYAVCVAASATSPPRLERIDLRSGRRVVLHDPNGPLRQRETTSPRLLSWNLPEGRAATGFLLLPSRAAGPVPLFVTYYYCSGYLRGGTGDEFPFGPMVDSGMAVACLNMVPGDDPSDTVGRYRTALASVDTIVTRLARERLVDPSRVGMGGFSAGSEATMWVAMNSGLLAAAAVSSPQYEPSSYWRNAVPGRDFARVLRDFIGLGAPDETPERWRLVSPALNVERINAPLLMQLPESEARSATELHSRLAATTTPVEMYAFPDEGHVKMQPRHRAAVYRRGLDWFRYWLQDHVDPDPAKAEQFRRWDELRRLRPAAQERNERSQVSADESSSSRM